MLKKLHVQESSQEKIILVSNYTKVIIVPNC